MQWKNWKTFQNVTHFEFRHSISNESTQRQVAIRAMETKTGLIGKLKMKR